MTIAQQFLGKNINKQQEEPLVPSEKAPTIKDAEEGKPVVVTMHTHVRRVSSMTTVCVFITALLVCSTGIIGGVYLYQQFAHYKLRHFHGWCSIPYNSDNKPVVLKAQAMKGSHSDATATEAWETTAQKSSFLEEEFDIDIKFEQYEKIDVPSFTHGKKARFIHDFTSNKTAIADFENRRCFVMILNERFVIPPRSLYSLISRMKAGFYDADTQVVRQNMRVVTPRLNEMKNIGIVITRDCNSLPIYLLERATRPVYKRSLDEESKNLFVEFAGNKIVEYSIQNINDATPADLLVKDGPSPIDHS